VKQQAKIAKEGEDLEPRNRAEEQIREQISAKREEKVRTIHQHQTKAEMRLLADKKEKRTKMFERSSTHAVKSGEARRLARMRQRHRGR
jgi:hypothetical protein